MNTLKLVIFRAPFPPIQEIAITPLHYIQTLDQQCLGFLKTLPSVKPPLRVFV